MDLTHATNAEQINAIVNDPSIYPLVRGTHEGPLDLTGLAADPRHVALTGQHGMALFLNCQPGLYEMHIAALPMGRGSWAVEMAHSAVHWLFAHTDAVEVWMRAPQADAMARPLAQALGATFEGVNRSGWIAQGVPAPCDIFSLKIQDWIRFAPGLIEAGRSFCESVNAEWARAERPFALDFTLDALRHLGAAVEMLRGAQPFKGAIFYARYAAMMNFLPIEIASVDPVIISLNGDFFEMHGKHFFLINTKSSGIN